VGEEKSHTKTEKRGKKGSDNYFEKRSGIIHVSVGGAIVLFQLLKQLSNSRRGNTGPRPNTNLKGEDTDKALVHLS